MALIVSGSTVPGATNWEQDGLNKDIIYVDVNTGTAGFSSTPAYIVSLGGTSSHGETIGGGAVYNASSTGFRIYLRWAKGGILEPETANSKGWHIVWAAFAP